MRLSRRDGRRRDPLPARNHQQKGLSADLRRKDGSPKMPRNRSRLPRIGEMLVTGWNRRRKVSSQVFAGPPSIPMSKFRKKPSLRRDLSKSFVRRASIAALGASVAVFAGCAVALAQAPRKSLYLQKTRFPIWRQPSSPGSSWAPIGLCGKQWGSFWHEPVPGPTERLAALTIIGGEHRWQR